MRPFGASGTIYDAPPAHPVTFAIGDPDLEEQLGGSFQAAHVWVNNPTNQAIYLPDADDFAPAGISGRVLALKHTDVARASWTIPSKFGLVQPPPLQGAAQLIFLNAGIEIMPQAGTTPTTPPFPGTTVPTTTLLAQATDAGGAEPFMNATVSPPAGSQLQIIGASVRIGFHIYSPVVVVTGVQTGFVYLNGVVGGIPSGTLLLAIQPADTSLQVTASGFVGMSVAVRALQQAVLVAIAQSAPTAPINPPKQIYARALAAAGTQTIIPAVVGQTIYVFGIQMTLDEAGFVPANATWVIRDSAVGANTFAALDGAAPVPFGFVDCRGAPTSVGAGLQLLNNDSVVHNGSVAVTFSQQ